MFAAPLNDTISLLFLRIYILKASYLRATFEIKRTSTRVRLGTTVSPSFFYKFTRLAAPLIIR